MIGIEKTLGKILVANRSNEKPHGAYRGVFETKTYLRSSGPSPPNFEAETSMTKP